MDSKSDKDKILLPHHEQQSLCTTRLPYRQGRKLTAVKVYTVNDESKHLLVFGVPSLNIKLETKSLFQKFGKITQFNISPYHEAELFTETYHLVYEKIQAARIAKRMLDGKNFYGGILHICYAPEYETIQETKEKLSQRKRDILYRIQYLKHQEKTKLPKPVEITGKNTQSTDTITTLASDSISYNLELPSHVIQKASNILPQSTLTDKIAESNFIHKKKLNMGETNTICLGRQLRDVVSETKKRKTETKMQHSVSKHSRNRFSNMVDGNQKMVECNKKTVDLSQNMVDLSQNSVDLSQNMVDLSQNSVDLSRSKNTVDFNKQMTENTTKLLKTSNIEVIDAFSVDNEILTNINLHIQENLNQNDIVIKKIPQKPMNVIKFNFPKKKS